MPARQFYARADDKRAGFSGIRFQSVLHLPAKNLDGFTDLGDIVTSPRGRENARFLRARYATVGFPFVGV